MDGRSPGEVADACGSDQMWYILLPIGDVTVSVLAEVGEEVGSGLSSVDVHGQSQCPPLEKCATYFVTYLPGTSASRL